MILTILSLGILASLFGLLLGVLIGAVILGVAVWKRWLTPSGVAAAFVTEVVLTLVFLVVIIGVTKPGAPAGFAPLAIGLTLVIIHLFAIPVDNASVNPARSTGPAVFVGGWALEQLWLFWVAPIIGAVLGAFIYRFIGSEEQ